MRIFVGSTHLKVDYVPPVTPVESGMWVVDSSAYRQPLFVNPTDVFGTARVQHTGALGMPVPTTQPVTTPVLGVAAVGGLAIAKYMGATWAMAAVAALGAPVVLLGVAALLTRLSGRPT